MNTIVMPIDPTQAGCNSVNAGTEQSVAPPAVTEGTEVPQEINQAVATVVNHPRTIITTITTENVVDNLQEKIVIEENSPVIRSITHSTVSTPVAGNVINNQAFPQEYFQSGTVPLVINKRSNSVEGVTQQEGVITSPPTVTRPLRSVIQSINAVELVVKDKNVENNTPKSKIFNIVQNTNNKNVTSTGQKMSLNNNNNNNGQRVQTITSVNAIQRGSNVNVTNPLKVHVLNSKGGITKAPLQVQRQVMSNLSTKQMGNGTKPILNKNVLPKNNMLKSPIVNNVKSYKTINRTPNKTIKTLSPQSPQQNYLPKTGIKTLSPQNHGKMKLTPNQLPRIGGIKTLTPQRPGTLNNKMNNLNKTNYIGKHAAQAHKSHQKLGPMKGRGQTRHSPTKYLQQKPGMNTQTSFNQALTAQILQSLPQPGGRTETYNKNYTANSPTNSNLSDDIGEEVNPEMSPIINYLYQVVMLDHNYSTTVAPLPTVSPPTLTPPIRQQSQPINGASNINQNYGYNPVTKRHRLNSGSLPPQPPVQSIPEPQDDDAASTISSEGHRDHPGEEGEETETAPEGDGDEDGITRCICDYDHDDGYMICCDICSSWQHVDCMGLDRTSIPEKYACVRCEPRRVDRAHARAIQQRKREELAASDSGSSGSDTSTAESTGGGDARHHSLSLNNNLIAKKRTGGPVPLAARRKSEPPLHQRRQSLAQKRQQQQQRRESIRDTSAGSVGRRTLKKREKKQVMKRKMKSRSSVDDDSQDSWPSPNIPTQTTTNVGANLLQLRQWIENYEEAVTNHYSPELRARLSNMRANGSHVPANQTTNVGGVGTLAPPTAQQDVQTPKSRIVTQPLTGIKILMSTSALPSNSAVIELRGKYMLSTQHRQSSQGPPGLLTRQNSQQRPGPFLFFYRLPKDGTEVCVDTRTYGNDARFIRRSCRPNAELRHCVEKGTLHLYVVTNTQVEKNQELTIRHETHDLAAVGTTNIACACGNPSQCGLFHNQRKNGGSAVVENVESNTQRKRRGRRTSSPALGSPTPVEPPLASPVVVPPPVTVPPPPPPAITTRRTSHHSTTRSQVSETPERIERREPREERETTKDKNKKKLTREERKMEAIMKAFERLEKQQQRKQENQARAAQRRESDPPPSRLENGEIESKTRRKRRKGRARTVSTTSQSNRRRTRLNSTDSYATSGDEGSLLSPPLPATDIQDKLPESPLKSSGSQISDISSPGQVTTAAGLLLALASGGNQQEQTLNKSPPRETDGNSSSSSIQSSPSTPLSSACLLVAAAVGPLEPGFKFPKTKKAIMNEWLNKSPEPIQPASSISPITLHPHTSPVSEQPEYYPSQNSGSKSIATLVQAASLCDSPPQTRHEKGNAKKRWLRQAISEECDSPCSRPESPPVAPPKKRRLARESLSSEQGFTPPSTPTMLVPPANSVEEDYPNNDEEFYTNEERTNDTPPEDFKSTNFKDSNRVEIVYSGHEVGEDLVSDQPEMEPDAVLKERVAEMRMEFGTASVKREEISTTIAECETQILIPPAPVRTILDPRLGRYDKPMFQDSSQLLGAVENTLKYYEKSFATPIKPEDKKPEVIPVKRKLSISEYRQRKQLTTTERSSIDEMNSSMQSSPGSPPPASSTIAAKSVIRRRSDSTSSTTSSLSSEEETNIGSSSVTSGSGLDTLDKTTGTVGFSSAPTAVELQRENVDRLKKVFGLSLDDESRKSATSRDSSITSPKSLLVSPPSISPANPSDIKSETSKYLLDIKTETETKFSETESFGTKLEASDYIKTKYSDTKEFKTSPKDNDSLFLDKKEVKELKRASSEEKEESSDEKFPKFDDSITTSFIPPFNNPVYPNSTQFTGYTSVIDSSPYEGRNPSPPPSEILTNSRYSETSLSLSPETGYK